MSRPMLAFVKVDLMCSFSPTACRLDQVAIIAPFPSRIGIPGYSQLTHCNTPDSLEPGFWDVSNEFRYYSGYLGSCTTVIKFVGSPPARMRAATLTSRLQVPRRILESQILCILIVSRHTILPSLNAPRINRATYMAPSSTPVVRPTPYRKACAARHQG